MATTFEKGYKYKNAVLEILGVPYILPSVNYRNFSEMYLNIAKVYFYIIFFIALQKVSNYNDLDLIVIFNNNSYLFILFLRSGSFYCFVFQYSVQRCSGFG
jgi:hypothetical protein